MFAVENWKNFLPRDLEPAKNDLLVWRTAVQLVAFRSTSLNTFAWRKRILLILAMKVPEMPDKGVTVVPIGFFSRYDIL